MKIVTAPSRFADWADVALSLLDHQVSPAHIVWSGGEEQPLLPGLGETLQSPASLNRAQTLPRSFTDLAHSVFRHRDRGKWDLLYRVLWRLRRETPHLLRIESDVDVCLFRRLAQQVRHDAYRMTQFVRFRKVTDAQADRYIAWHRPDHHVLPLAAPFFVRRFASLRWSIFTPDASAHWDRQRLTFGHGAPRQDTPNFDELESLWRTYYATICNPARINPGAMQAQMPKRFWAQLPEAGEITSLLAQAPNRVDSMIIRSQSPTAATFVPGRRELPFLVAAARACQGCELHEAATQTVFGGGPSDASIMVIGEQPGDEEDRQGVPFVGPAGRILDRALTDAGLDRAMLYVTNAVKHFWFTLQGRARKHQTPRPSHIVACRPWLDAEIGSINPRIIVCLGATAARSILGHAVPVMRHRGTLTDIHGGRKLLITVHPSAVLRAADSQTGERVYQSLVSDLRLVREETSI